MPLSLSVEFPRSFAYRILPNLKNSNAISIFRKSGKTRGSVKVFILLAAVFFPLAVTTLSHAAQVTFAWDANMEPDLAGYRIYYGTSSGIYPFHVDVGNHTGCSLSGLKKGTTYFFAVTGYATDGNESDFSTELVYTVPFEADDTLASIIIDNGDPGTSHTGRWKTSYGANPYGNDSLYSYKGAYSFESAAEDIYEVSIWWTTRKSRCRSVPVEIYDGENLLEIVEVNQRINGGQWNYIGAYNFNGRARVVIISEGKCSTSADAVEFMP